MTNANKKIVFWGTGRYAQKALLSNSEVEPYFFIDKKGNGEFLGKMVYAPEDITEWKDLFVVVCVRVYEDIFNYLTNLGLQEDEDYVHCSKFFDFQSPTIYESYLQMKTYCRNVDISKPRILMCASILMESKNRSSRYQFFQNYMKANTQYEYIFFSEVSFMSTKDVKKMLGTMFFRAPDILVDYDIKEPIKYYFLSELNEEEKNTVKEIARRKETKDFDKLFRIYCEIYGYLKTILKLLQVQGVVLWGGWSGVNYLLEAAATSLGIKAGYMEYGWIPGTIQFDPSGIAGQSEYAKDSLRFNQIPICNDIDVKRIKQEIIQNKLDTSRFNENRTEQIKLDSRNMDVKTVLLIGMGDTEMRLNRASEYWKTYVSGIYQSISEVLVDLIPICEMNGWNLVFKPHPESPIEWNEELDKRVLRVETLSVDRLIEASDVVVSIASAVDYKALIYGKPVVQVGVTGLNGKGCTYEVKERSELEAQLRCAIENGMTLEQEENFDNMINRLLQTYLWDNMEERNFRYGLPSNREFFI